jgi:hypothetical protein
MTLWNAIRGMLLRQGTFGVLATVSSILPAPWPNRLAPTQRSS